METHEEAMAHSNSSSSTGESLSPVVRKRKRTKRHRTLPSPPTTAAASSASSGSTEEEEDMANCLILLAQGRTIQVNEGATTMPGRAGQAGQAGQAGRAGFYVYECKTCNKCFPSFQALGGHRASHKKPKMAALESEITSSLAKPMASLSSGGKQRIHECSICGSEFSSGQALGGHMRRHRPAVLMENSFEIKKEKSVLLLDLNLPAPADDDPFVGVSGKPLDFSPSVAAAMVDCHY